MIWQTNSSSGWWNQISFLVFLSCFKIWTAAHVSRPLKSSLPWQNSVGWYIILCCVKTDDPADDFLSEMVRTEVPACLFGSLQNPDWIARQSSVEVITALAKVGTLIYHFVLCKGWWASRRFPLQDGETRFCWSSCWTASRSVLGRTSVICWSHCCLCGIRLVDISFCTMRRVTIWQMISTPRWWKQMSLLVFLDCFKIRARTYASHLSKPLLPWQKSVGWDIILYCAKTDDPADNFRSEIVESDVLVHLVDLLQYQNSDECQLSIKAITTLAKFGRLIYQFALCKDWRSSRKFPLQHGGSSPCSSFRPASRSGLRCTPVIHQGHYCLGGIS